MKKILLTTTALASIFASTAMAQIPTPPDVAGGPTVSVGGLVNFEAGSAHNAREYRLDSAGNTTNYDGRGMVNKSIIFNTLAKAHIRAVGKADNGLVYGGVIGLTTNANRYSLYTSNELDRTYGFLETSIGRIEVGSNYGATKTMKVDASSIARASGGIAGNWFNYANQYQQLLPGTNPGSSASSTLSYFPYLMSPDFITDYSFTGANVEESNKITLYTPRVNGFQLGLSYSPSSTNTGSDPNDSAYKGAKLKASRDYKNAFSGGITFTSQYDQVGLNLSILGEMAKAPSDFKGETTSFGDVDSTGKKQNRNLKGWATGGSINVGGFSVAGSYGVTGKKYFQNLSSTNRTNKNLKYWTAGAAYVQGPVGISATYLDSSFENNKLTNLVVGADYALAPGVMPYIEASFFNMKPALAKTQPTLYKANKGKAYVLGMSFRF